MSQFVLLRWKDKIVNVTSHAIATGRIYNFKTTIKRIIPILKFDHTLGPSHNNVEIHLYLVNGWPPCHLMILQEWEIMLFFLYDKCKYVTNPALLGFS